jgi:hypothetical protein
VLPQAHQSAQQTGGGSMHSDGSSTQQKDRSGAASLDGKDGAASGPPTPLLDDLFREGTAWSEGRLPEVLDISTVPTWRMQSCTCIG